MFTLMANCFTWIKKRREPRKEVTLLMVGLDNAGKTSTVSSVQGDDTDCVVPTIGFLQAKFTFERSEVTLFDLGGGAKIRSIWHSYYAESYGIIFVVDSSDETRIDEGKKILKELVSQPKTMGKPLLVLANKKDKEGAMSEHEVDQRLDLAYLCQKHKTPYEVYSCSATLGTGKKMDKQIKKGLQWLLSAVTNDYATLTERVTHDVAIQKEAEAKEKARIREEVRKRIEEREKAEAEAAASAAAEDKEVESDDGLVIGEKKKKHVSHSDEGERSPEVSQKKKKKKRKKKKKVIESDNEEEDIELRSSIAVERHSPAPTPDRDVEEHREVEEYNEVEEESRVKPRKHHNIHEIMEDDEDNEHQDIIKPKLGPLRTFSHESDHVEHIVPDSQHRERAAHKDIDNNIKLDNEYVENALDDQEEPIPEVKVKKKKKKKKKLKSNKTAPALEDDLNEEDDKLPPLGWGTSGSLVNGFGNGRVPPRLEPLRPPIKSTFDPRAIAESIPEQSDDDSPFPRSNWARYRPNSEDQDIVT